MELLFCESESAFSDFAALRSDLEQHGKPVALYSDKAGVFAHTMSLFRLLRARTNCVTPVPPPGSFVFTRNTVALSLYSATGLPRCSRYERIAAK